VHSKEIKDIAQEVEMQIINPMYINVAIMVYKGLEDFGEQTCIDFSSCPKY